MAEERGGRMTREKIIRLLNEYHVKALNSPYVQKPWAWALYQTWRDIDSEEKPRGIVIKVEEKDG